MTQELEDTGSNKEKEDKLPNTTSFQSKELFWEDSDSEVGEEADVMPEGEGPVQRLSPPRRAWVQIRKILWYLGLKFMVK